MPAVLDATTRSELEGRLARLSPQSPRLWGRMTPDQMLWHVNQGFENALGRFDVAPIKVPLPRPLLRFLVFALPWGKGKARTAPELVAQGAYDFDGERQRLVRLMAEFCACEQAGPWPDSSFLGPMSGRDWSRLMAKHVDHHLRQFGA